MVGVRVMVGVEEAVGVFVKVEVEVKVGVDDEVRVGVGVRVQTAAVAVRAVAVMVDCCSGEGPQPASNKQVERKRILRAAVMDCIVFSAMSGVMP
jgi:hypothetical protein